VKYRKRKEKEEREEANLGHAQKKLQNFHLRRV
jgi:hypothetical protein